jgi:DHH subfamily 1 protein
VLIDHHLNPTIDGIVTVSHPEASSTCELVFRVICQLGGFEQLTQQIAAPIYCGMMTDTGGFTYNSTRPVIYTIIGMLLTTGIDKDKIYRNVFNNYSQWAIRLRGFLMSERLCVFDEYHAAYFTVSRRDMKRFHFVKGDLEGLVNEPLRIKGLKFSVSLREDDRHDNLILVSLRSVDDFPCNEVAAEFFNGGGHLNASGGKLHCSLKEAEVIMQRALLKYADRLKA